jgi:hypothetical protein
MPKIYCDGNSTLSSSLAFLRLSVALGVDESGEAGVSPPDSACGNAVGQDI